ncbi:MAG TPA: FAD-dependent oxidoreductase [Blastocatellia bacterium]|nr:FAD-dependent oxidoreductase [Blastocatellia bacterium]
MSGNVIVLGAGLAGLSAAHHLDYECEVFEKEPHIGGHCRTKRVDGFNFDEGAHVFFGKDDCSREFVWEPLGEEMIPHRAEIWNNYGGKTIGRYPVQANASAIGPELATRCVLDFIEATKQPEADVRTYSEWCYASFGKTFSEEFMLRYARKVWTVEPEEMNTEWLGSKVGGRISRPSLEQVVRGAIDPDPQELNYLTEFSYPERGGFGRIAEPLASRVSNLKLGCGVTRIETEARRITFSDGTARDYAAAISTIPLPTLVRLAVDAPAEVREAADKLMWTSVRVVNLGIAREDVGPGHWVYFYDNEIPFFRVSFPSKFAPDNAPPGHSSVSCEIAYSRRKPLDEDRLMERTVDALNRTGILRSSDQIVVTDQIDIPYAYVVFDFNREPSLRAIHAWMESVGLYACGRFGEWGYHWSFEAIESGRRVAARVAEHLGITMAV